MASITKSKVIGKGEKPCNNCGQVRPYSAFYVRSGYGTPEKPAIMDGHFISECKSCMKKRTFDQERLPPWESRVKSEQYAIDYLMAHGIWATTGKMTNAPDVDIAARGMVWVEAKYAELGQRGRTENFVFSLSATQIERGFLAHIVMLICEWPGERTFHLFNWNAPYFYHDNGQIKTSITYTPDEYRKSNAGTRSNCPLTDEVMYNAQDNLKLIDFWQGWIEAALNEGQKPVYGKPFAR